MDAVCLLVAGIVRATLPTTEFALDWQHSVEKIRWVEHYHVERDHLVLTEARVEGFGAGMEPPPDAVLRDGGWTWQPRQALPELRLTRSGYTQDYRVCWHASCRTLGALVGPTADGAVIVVRPCTGGAPR